MLPLSPAGRRYGFKPSPPDHRDFGVTALPFRVGSLQQLVDLESFCGPVFDQGDEGSCTANAGCGNFEYLLRKFRGDQTILSRAFLYYQERLLDGSLQEGDCGSTGRSSCKAMRQFGVCSEEVMPYVPGNFSQAPSEQALTDAKARISGAYHALRSVYDMKSCLASGYCCLIGFTVYASFEDNWPTPGIMPAPNKQSEEILGGHEVLVIGYDNSKNAFKVRNSWGVNWGEGGNFWMPYQLAADPDILNEAWIQHLGAPWK